MSADGEVQYLRLLKRKNNRLVSDTNSLQSAAVTQIKIKKSFTKKQEKKKKIEKNEP